MSEDDIKFEDQAEDDQGADEIPREQRQLRTQAYDKSISDLVAMMEADDILLDPDYQRNYIWDDTKASLLIESILLNVPIPVVYVSEEEDGEWSVVDGLQRLNTLRRFFGGEFKLKRLEVLTELNGCSMSMLNPKASRLLRNGIIRTILIAKESHPEIKYDIFMRLNRGAVRLTEQELRNCLYRGPFNKLLHDIRKDAWFLTQLGRSVPHKRMADAEIVLRFFMLSTWYDAETGSIAKYSGNMRSSLNKFMDTHRNAPEHQIEAFQSSFNESLDKVRAVFGDSAFRTWKGNSFDERPNRAIIDSQMVAMSVFSKSLLIQHANQIMRAFKELCISPEYRDAVTLRTSNKAKTEYRVDVFARAIDDILR